MAQNKEKEIAKGESEVIPPLDPQERRRMYNRAVREARLVTILLSGTTFKVTRENTPSEEDEIVPSYKGVLKEVSYQKEFGACLIQIEWQVQVKVHRKQFVKCTATYDIIYDGFKEASEEIVSLLAENVAKPASYAYFRALYANLDWSADLRFPPLPIIKFQPKV